MGCNNKLLDVATVKNQQEYERNKITKEQSNVIFENSKVFPDKTEISIALIKDGIPHYYGAKRVNDMLVSTENYENVFGIGSITKVFTATLLAELVLDSRVQLDDNINQYLNFTFKNNQEITFEELANHTSGLPGMPTNFTVNLTSPNPFEKFDNNLIREYLTNELELSHSFITKYRYSNFGAALLSYTLSEVTRDDYSTLLQENIFSKYGMSNSTIDIEETSTSLIQGLSSSGEPVQNWELAALSGAGAIISSVEDLSKFVIAQFDKENKELELTRAKTYWISPINEIGLGWHIKKKILRDDWYWHNGGTVGYSSCVVLNPITRNSIIVLTNVSSFSRYTGNVDKVCIDLMKVLENDQP